MSQRPKRKTAPAPPMAPPSIEKESPKTALPAAGTMECERKQRFSAMTLLYFTVCTTFWLHYDSGALDALFQRQSQWSYSWHSHNFTSPTSAIVCLFTHADWEHVGGNMFLLWVCGRRVFMKSAGVPWTCPWAFLLIYLGSQFSSALGCRLLSYWLELTWNRKLLQERLGWWDWIPFSLRDTWSTMKYFPEKLNLRFWQLAPMMGASAAVFGVVGAHIYTANVSQQHPDTMGVASQAIWFLMVAKELSNTPFSLEHVSLLVSDNIDHASHLFGFLGGFVLAAVCDVIAQRRLRSL